MTDASKPGDEAPSPSEEPAGEDLCPVCSGSGRVDGETCRECEGTGTITEGVGGA